MADPIATLKAGHLFTVTNAPFQWYWDIMDICITLEYIIYSSFTMFATLKKRGQISYSDFKFRSISYRATCTWVIATQRYD